MHVPLYQAKADFFRMLGHPVRIRVLELLQHGPVPVRDLLADIDIEPSSLSQQLAVLRRSGIVVSIREGSTVSYALAGGDVAELLRAARRILTELLAGQNQLLTQLQQADTAAPEAPADAGGILTDRGSPRPTPSPAVRLRRSPPR
ncbi:DNA-binding transcriptional ArsR family regulator [Streptomyces sp. SAI-133]|uniref:ArsR/SmtB family transcription factor n=1 Tax=unclassified Streptomyces TaxID=2593676 RepID=UPI002473EBE3|nr:MULTISPECIES: metalloregulator ArsR/SmtB family transcription factor [unclassified Streptomyces]MDH6553031.1 DNA-binding transcriptional ArsR family regulator [Streptomyces sp. SAI-041]MDH6582925.1 DNA-binding transcriptional ArsR family regulator [Streptomyces sp. SAI-133]